MLDLDATVHYDEQPGVTSLSSRFFVNQPELHPDHLRTALDRLFHDPRNRGRIAENIHDLERRRHIPKRGITLAPQDLTLFRIDGRDLIPVLHEIHAHKMTRTVRVA